MALRQGTVRLTLGVRMALLPAILAAALTLATGGVGRRGVGLAVAAGVGLLVLLVLALPIDLLGGRASYKPHAGRGRPPRRQGRQG
jgi:hypothetical protein